MAIDHEGAEKYRLAQVKRLIGVHEDAGKYRLAQAETLLDLFEAAHGRAARTTQEPGEWFDSLQGRIASAHNRAKDGKSFPTLEEGVGVSTPA
jgi:hypothetical protein